MDQNEESLDAEVAAKIGIVATSSAELARLAARLDSMGMLAMYVHPYIATGRRWETALCATPGVGKRLSRQLKKRAAPQGIDPRLIRSAAPVEELVSGFLAPISNHDNVRAVRSALTHRRNRRMSHAAACASKEVDVLVASHGAAYDAFRLQQPRAINVLNYQSSHHRYQFETLSEEAHLFPELASTLGIWSIPQRSFDRFDMECMLAEAILVGSSHAKKTFVERGLPADRVHVVPYGVDTNQFFPAPENRNDDNLFKVLYVGRIGQDKGIQYLLDAYRAFRKENTQLTLIGNYQGDASAFARQAGSFIHLPHMPHDELRGYYQQASLLVLPSLMEGMGMVVLEAMASGLPVIVTDHGPNEVVGDGIDGFVVPVRNPEAIAVRLEQLYQDPALCARMGAAARARAQSLSWETYASNVVDILTKLIEDKKMHDH